ncbi:MAG TPA: type II toxin-antitoxin system death-on-curing family toxin [Bacteroidia bacterium]|nr:type II toxin-antitoxin system death-on-curing family toxin [Bacteroidia bacterium]
MFSLKEAIQIHEVLITRFGGAQGVRDQAGLESALARPVQTFDGVDLYPAPQAKAAALMESLVINHPFVDGNKRIAYTLYRLCLLNAGLDIGANQAERYEMVIEASKGELRFEDLLTWTEKHLQKST